MSKNFISNIDPELTKVIYFEPQSIEWKVARQNYVTATDIASLFGLNPNKSFAKFYRGKTQPEHVPDNLFMKVGRYLEPAVFEALSEHVIKTQKAHENKVVFVTNEKHKISCSLDGLAKGKKDIVIVEAKTTVSEKKFEIWQECPPLEYLLQVQVQMMLCKKPHAILACLLHALPMPLIVYKITANQELQDIITTGVDKFWSQLGEYKVDRKEKKIVEELAKQTFTLIGEY